MIRRPPRSTRVRSSAASDVYKRQVETCGRGSQSDDWQEDVELIDVVAQYPTPYCALRSKGHCRGSRVRSSIKGCWKVGVWAHQTVPFFAGMSRSSSPGLSGSGVYPRASTFDCRR